jgi:hypothetical protein
MVELWEPRLRELKRYWDGKRGDRTMPARADLDPLEIPELLPYLVLVDTAETLEEFRYRLIGTEACAGFDRDPTGARFADLPRTERFDEVYNGYWRTFRERTPQYFHGPFAMADGPIELSRLTLPLSLDGNHVDMILGGIVYSSTPE